jgi:predicted protein tyrosine phosphatase
LLHGSEAIVPAERFLARQGSGWLNHMQSTEYSIGDVFLQYDARLEEMYVSISPMTVWHIPLWRDTYDLRIALHDVVLPGAMTKLIYSINRVRRKLGRPTLRRHVKTPILAGLHRRYQIFAREDLECLARAEEHAIISITEPRQRPARLELTELCRGILRVTIDDVSRAGALAHEDADKIISFTQALQPDVPAYVHCEAGISRSAAVVAALLRLAGDDPTYVFQTKRPNPSVYRELLDAAVNAAGEDHSKSAATAKRLLAAPER